MPTDDMAEMTPAQKKLFELRMKVNAGRKANKKEVAAEHDRVANRNNKAKKEKLAKQWEDKKKKEANIPVHLEDTAEDAEEKFKKLEKKSKKRAAFGWDVFNQDALYKGYKKRLVNLPTNAETAQEAASDALEDELSHGRNAGVSAEALDQMANELEERIKSRKKFSRRRQFIEGEDVDYINHQNRLFNRKASQAYDKYTVEVRQNLERGTAL